ncbi:MAG: type I methionyl aminopeptidase [Planctomycetota bacterium]|jgi:methionyl aminopeptidase|nr:type I methionyl aminopeptidase [Planctomycetota bacterium]
MSGRNVILKTPADIAKMRESGRVVARALDLVGKMVSPGVTTGELSAAVEELICNAGGVPTFKGYPASRRGIPDFPAAICASVNEQVVHGIPGDRELREGDIISVDVGVHLDGWCGDAAKTFPVGQVGRKAKKLLEVTESSLKKAILNARPGRKLRDVSAAVQNEAEAGGFSVVRQFVGHGIGRDMHEPPQIPNFVCRSGETLDGEIPDLTLCGGMALAIEPMVNAGSFEVLVDKSNGWTVYTKDRSLSAHFEHTVAVTADGPLILTEL